MYYLISSMIFSLYSESKFMQQSLYFIEVLFSEHGHTDLGFGRLMNSRSCSSQWFLYTIKYSSLFNCFNYFFSFYMSMNSSSESSEFSSTIPRIFWRYLSWKSTFFNLLWRSSAVNLPMVFFSSGVFPGIRKPKKVFSDPPRLEYSES